MASSSRVVWINGDLVPESQARISIYDSALMFGDMVFEMTRSFNKEQFKLREHLERLYRSINMVQIPVHMSIDEMEAVVHQTIEANMPAFASDDEHRILINVSRGLLSIYQGVVGTASTETIVVADFPLRWTVAGMGKLFDTGINAVIPSQRAIPAELLDPKIKSRSRLHLLMGNIEVSRVEGDNNWALLLDTDGFIAEGTGDNFFMVKDGVIYTPEGRNILRGISREYILKEIGPQLGFKVAERNIEKYDVLDADEAFMTGTPFCVLPVTSLDGSPIGDGEVGTITNALIAKWSESVGVDIRQQIKDWDATGNSDSGSAPSPYRFTRP